MCACILKVIGQLALERRSLEESWNASGQKLTPTDFGHMLQIRMLLGPSHCPTFVPVRLGMKETADCCFSYGQPAPGRRRLGGNRSGPVYRLACTDPGLIIFMCMLSYAVEFGA